MKDVMFKEEEVLVTRLEIVAQLRQRYAGRKNTNDKNPLDEKIDVVADAFDALREVKANKELPFGSFVLKYKLDDKEALIVMILLEEFLTARESSRGYELAKAVSFGRPLELIKNLELLGAKAPLGTNGIICPRYFHFGESTGNLQFYLTDKAVYELCGHEMKKEKKAVKGNEFLKFKSPAAIFEELNKYVIGQEEAKRALSIGVFNHYKRINDKTGKGEKVDKSNIMLIGPTGSGKTMLCKTLATLLGVPMVICDVTTFTEKGYVGGDVEDALSRLYKASGNDLKRAERGIIYLDEIDKISAQNAAGRHNTSRDVSGKSVQEELLKLLEANVIHPVQKMIGGDTFPPMNTKNILFIAGGAFDGIEDFIEEDKKSTLGFCRETEEVKNTVKPKITGEHIIQYGFMPELVGRMHVLAILKSLTVDDLLAIIKNPENGLLVQFQNLFSMNGFKLEIDEDILRFVATEALAKGSGARGLRSVMEELLQDAMFNSFGNPEAPKEIYITAKNPEPVEQQVQVVKNDKVA